MADFYKSLKEAAQEMRIADDCDLDLVKAHLQDMRAAYGELENESNYLRGSLRLLRCAECNHYRHKGEWANTEKGDPELGEDPNKRYCTMCGSEIVDGKCSWKPDEEVAG